MLWYVSGRISGSWGSRLWIRLQKGGLVLERARGVWADFVKDMLLEFAFWVRWTMDTKYHSPSPILHESIRRVCRGFYGLIFDADATCNGEDEANIHYKGSSSRQC